MNPLPATPVTTAAVLLPALSLRLVRLLGDALARGFGNSPTVRLTQPRELAHGSAEGITLTLLGVQTLAQLRNPPSRPGQTAAPVNAIEAHYLLTAWASQAALQQWILAAGLRQLQGHALITTAELEHPFIAGADLGVDPAAAIRLTTASPGFEQAAALATALGAPALPPSLLVVAGPITLG